AICYILNYFYFFSLALLPNFSCLYPLFAALTGKCPHSANVTLPIHINGKRRGEITVAKDLPKEEVEKLALAHEAVVRALDGAQPKKMIVVPGRIVNVVV
ncbi:MAG: hypothetical protein VX228_02535, partial [Pseudomonadota bacterium]|nr:hypothetical protein [Pseudomonadota bacterium]